MVGFGVVIEAVGSWGVEEAVSPPDATEGVV